jgi:hypothetical protein
MPSDTMPSTLFSLAWTLAAHAAHFMPPMTSSTSVTSGQR